MAIDYDVNTTRVYTDFNQLKTLETKAKDNSEAALREVAKEFESVMMQMVMKSMRDANKAFESDLVNHDQMDFYQNWFDQQLSQNLGDKGFGIADMLVNNLSRTNPAEPKETA